MQEAATKVIGDIPERHLMRRQCVLALPCTPRPQPPIDAQAQLNQALNMPAPRRYRRSLELQDIPAGQVPPQAAKRRRCRAGSAQQYEIGFARRVADGECRLDIVVAFDGGTQQPGEYRVPLHHAANCDGP